MFSQLAGACRSGRGDKVARRPCSTFYLVYRSYPSPDKLTIRAQHWHRWQRDSVGITGAVAPIGMPMKCWSADVIRPAQNRIDKESMETAQRNFPAHLLYSGKR
jgi:hypothetical protein